MAGRQRVEVSPPFFSFFLLGVGGGGGGLRSFDKPYMHCSSKVHGTSFKSYKLVLEPSRNMPVSLITFTALAPFGAILNICCKRLAENVLPVCICLAGLIWFYKDEAQFHIQLKWSDLIL